MGKGSQWLMGVHSDGAHDSLSRIRAPVLIVRVRTVCSCELQSAAVLPAPVTGNSRLRAQDGVREMGLLYTVLCNSGSWATLSVSHALTFLPQRNPGQKRLSWR